MDSIESRIKHLELIQGVVNRLAGNSFAMKGWAIALVTALIAIAVDRKDGRFAFAGLLPTLLLWFLDGYFLWQERLFRTLYDAVRLGKRDKPEDCFSMDTRPYLNSTSSWYATAFAVGKKPNTLLIFYGAVALCVLIAALLIR